MPQKTGAHTTGSVVYLNSDLTVFPRSRYVGVDCIRREGIEPVAVAQMGLYCEHSASSARLNDIANDQFGFTRRCGVRNLMAWGAERDFRIVGRY